MAAVHASAWLLVSRWEQPGKGAQHRVKLRAPRFIRLGFDVSLYASFLYPVLVLIGPRWISEGRGTWSSSIDGVLLAGGLVLWMLGVAILLWASWVMGRYLAIDGLAEDHQLLTHGPYRYLRHPVYVSFAAIAIGTALVFRSYVVLGLSVMLMITGRWWADAEERLLASPEGFGHVYRAYATRTGRFFPNLRLPKGTEGRGRS